MFSRTGSSAFGASQSTAAFSSPQAAQNQPQNGSQIVVGEMLEDKETEKVGFKGLNGDAKIRIFGESYANSLPIPTASLLSIAQKRGLVAGAGPQGIVISRTSSLRQAFSGPNKGVMPPDAAIPIPLKISHVAFTADEKYLLLGAEVGGIACYLVDDIMSQGSNAQSSFQISSPPLREMHPIPTTDRPELVCILTGNEWGQEGVVSMVNLNTREISKPMQTGVTTVSWSPKGKQIVCGGIGGGILWITPEGDKKSECNPPPTPKTANCFVSSLLWIETHVFYITYTPLPNYTSHDSETTHFVLTRTAQSGVHTFSKVTDTAQPYGMSSRPTHYDFVHLRSWGDLGDMLVLTNTSSADVGLVTRFNGHNWSSNSVAQDARRAGLPMSSDGMDTTPIGLALDLSLTKEERVKDPIVGNSGLPETATPQPVIYILNHEGLLAAWWIIYDDACKAGEAGVYPGLIAYGGGVPATPAKPSGQAQPPSAFSTTQPSAFGAPTSTPNQSAFGISAFGAPSQMGSAFGRTSSMGPGNAFGSPTPGQGIFGQASQGTGAFSSPRPNAFGTPQGQPAFGVSSFGTPAPPSGNTQGQQSAFAQPSFGQTSASTFGQAPNTFGSPAPPTSAFGTPSLPNALSGGLPNALSGGQGAFGSPSPTSAFGAPSTMGQPAFGSTSGLGIGQPKFGTSAFGTSAAAPTPGGGHVPFGQVSQLGGSKFGTPAASSGPITSGFGKFAAGGGFSAAAAAAVPTGNTFGGGGATTNTFGSGGNNFQTKDTEPDAFAAAKGQQPSFGQPAATSNFITTSGFAATATPDTNTPTAPDTSSSMFGEGLFGSTLPQITSNAKPSAAANVPGLDKEETMEDSDDEDLPKARPAVTGGNMFNLGGITSSSAAPTAGAGPAQFGQGMFGGAMKSATTTQAGDAFKPAPSTSTIPSTFQKPIEEQKPSIVGTGLFGQTMAANKITPALATGGELFGGKSATLAFGSSFGQPAMEKKEESKKVGPTPVKEERDEAAAAAAATGLPDDSGDEGEVGESVEAEAPLPPDFTTNKASWGADKKLGAPPGADTKKAVLASTIPSAFAKPAEVKKAPSPVADPGDTLPPDFTTHKASWGADKKLGAPPGAATSESKPQPTSKLPVPSGSGGLFARTGPSASAEKKEEVPKPAAALGNLFGDALKKSQAEKEKEKRAGGISGTPAPTETPAKASGGLFDKVGTPKDEPKPSGGLFDRVGTPKTDDKPSSGYFGSTTTAAPTAAERARITPIAGSRAKGASGSGMGRPLTRDSGKKVKPASTTPKTAEKSAPAPFSMLGAAMEQFKREGSPSSSVIKPGGSIFDSAPKKAGSGSDFFKNLPTGPVDLDTSDSDEEEDDEDDEEEEEGDAQAEEKEGWHSDDEKEAGDAEWVSKDYATDSPVEVKYHSGNQKPTPSSSSAAPAAKSMFDRAGSTQTQTQTDSNKAEADAKAKLIAAQKAKRDAAEAEFNKAEADAKAKVVAAQKAKRDAAEAEAKRLSDLKAAEAARLKEEQRRVAEAKAAEERRIKAEIEAERRRKVDQELAVIRKEEDYRSSLQSPFAITGELVEFMHIRGIAKGERFGGLDGLDGIMEMVYITIDRSVAIFGANMRNLEAYTSHHKSYDPKTMDSIDDADADWKMSNIEDMGRILSQLIMVVKEVQSSMRKMRMREDAVKLVGEVDNLMLRTRDIPNILILETHPAVLNHFKLKPLSASQKLQRANLRRALPLLKTALVTAEEKFTILQAAIASTNDKFGTSFAGVKMPTVDAVRQTILKLSRTAKKQAEQLDLMEDGLRKLRLRSSSPALTRGNSIMVGAAGARGTRSRSALSATPEPSRRRTTTAARETPIKEEPESSDDDTGAGLFRIPFASSYDDHRSPLRQGQGQTSAAKKVRELEEAEMRERFGSGVGRKKWDGVEEYADEKVFRKVAGGRMRRVLKGVGVRETS